MKNRRRQSRSLKQRTRLTTRVLLVSGSLGVSATLVIGWLVYMNLQKLEATKAAGSNQHALGGSTASGEILCEYTWEKDPVTVATLGPDAWAAASGAKCAVGGRSGTKGLAVESEKWEGLSLQGSPYLDQDGLDISVDYNGGDKNGLFFCRGNAFRFGLDNGYLTISFRVDNEKGGFTTINERTDYPCINDGQYRTYRFSYMPQSGRAEIAVNGAPVWAHKGPANRAMYWKNAGDAWIARNLTGNTVDKAFLDNFIIRTTGSVSPLAESLINFMLEGNNSEITIHFATTNEETVASYAIERSTDGTKFEKIGDIAPGSIKKSNDEYVVRDPAPPTSGVVYYRLRQQFKSGKFVVHALSAIRIKSEKGFSIERINPQPFDNSFDVAYFLPTSGRVWIQLQDEKGSVVSSKTFEAKAGKNVHAHRQDAPLPQGTYVLNIIFNNKKISSRIIKA
jgi:hypothetical protein